MYKLIFWDFDGVIKDSLEVKTSAFVKLFEQYGSSVSERVQSHHENNGGMSRLEKFPIYLQWAGIEPTEEKIDQLCKKFSDLVMEEVIQSPWVPGVEDYLRTNPHDQIFIVVSATPQSELEKILQELDIQDCFAAIYGSPVKKSEAIQLTVNSYKIHPRECLMIGDARADMEAAAANQVPFLLRRHATNAVIFKDYTGPSIKDLTEI